MTDVPFLEPPNRFTTDMMPIHETSARQINLDAVEQHISEATERGRYDGPKDAMAYLRTRKAIVTVGETDYLTVTGLLCFGLNPQEVFPHAVINLGYGDTYESMSNDDTHMEKSIGGSIFEQITRIENHVWQNIHHEKTLNPTSLLRSETHEYPRAVIRELGTNMVAHRDYALYALTARVQIFRNRIEWNSPGGLPKGMTIAKIITKQRPRNPHIMRVLYDAGYIEARGQGLDTVVAELRKERMTMPEFKDTGTSFRVTVYGRTSEALRGGVASDLELTPNQRMILTFIRAKGRVPPRDIHNLFPERANRSHQRDIKFLLDSGLIVAQGGSRSIYYMTPDLAE